MNKSHKLSSFEGLRGLASFSVVISHLSGAFFLNLPDVLQVHLGFLPDFLTRTVVGFIEGLYCGTFAVWLFWIMSGFVLSLQFFLRVHQLPPERAHDYLEDAFLRRYVRLLLPVLASVLVAYVLHACHLMRNIPVAQTLGEPYISGWLGKWYLFPASLPGALQSAVWNTFFEYNPARTYNNVLWTMQYEFYGSLFLFAYLGVLGHRNARFIIYLAIALATLKLNMVWLDSFVAGIALCDFFVNRERLFPRLAGIGDKWPVFHFVRDSHAFALVLWIGIIIGVGLVHHRDWHGRIGDLAYLVLGVAAIALTLVSKTTQRLLAGVIPQFLGRISFGLYLIHIPVIFSFTCWFYLASVKSLGPTFTVVASCFLTCLLSVVFGYLLYLVADLPGIHLSRALSQRIMNATGPSRHRDQLPVKR